MMDPAKASHSTWGWGELSKGQDSGAAAQFIVSQVGQRSLRRSELRGGDLPGAAREAYFRKETGRPAERCWDYKACFSDEEKEGRHLFHEKSQLDPGGNDLLDIAFYFCVLFLGGPHLRHVEIPRLGFESELQLPAYTTATAMPDPSPICDLHCSSR